MSKLNDLIRQYAPDGVEFVPLWTVTTWDKKFNAVDRSKQPNVINYPYLLAGDLFALDQEGGSVFLLSTGERTGWTTEELVGSYICEGEVVTIPCGKSRPVQDVLKYYKGKFVTADNRIATSNNMNILLNKYLYYWMMTQGDVIDSFYRGSGIKHPSMADVLDMQIPLPPLPIQHEIVRILDNFTGLTAELTAGLTAELTARKKQYEYYRDALLTFEETATQSQTDRRVRWVTLSEIATFKYGYTDRAKDSGTARFLRITDIDEQGVLIPTGAKYIDLSSKNAEYQAKKGDLLMARTGATFGKTLFVDSDEPAVYASFLIKIVLNNSEITNRYYWHFSKSQMYWEQANALVSKAGQPQFNANALRRVKTPVPSLEEQARIVGILDRFDVLTNDLTQGLTAEIAARRKQYEYYRDKLLTFGETIS